MSKLSPTSIAGEGRVDALCEAAIEEPDNALEVVECDGWWFES